MINNTDDIISLDYGLKRIGVARVSPIVKIAEPLAVIDAQSDDVVSQISSVVSQNEAQAVVIGLPRGLDGQETEQTSLTRDFAQDIAVKLECPVYMVDEAGSTQAAKDRIAQSSSDAPLDSVAAAVIAEDFVQHSDKLVPLQVASS